MLTEEPPMQPREPQWDRPALSGRAIGGCFLLVAVAAVSGVGFWAMRTGQLRFDLLERLTGTAPTPTPAVEVPTTVDATTAIEAPTPTPDPSPLDADRLQKDIDAQFAQRVKEMEARLGKARQPDHEVLRTGGEVTVPVAISRVQPTYTDEARHAGTQGVVIVEAVIDEHGDVSQVRVLKGLPNGLDTAAADAVKQWKFAPAKLHGKPVAAYFTVTINFMVDSRPRPD